MNLLEEKGIKFKKSGPLHIILENFDFCPSTGKFISKDKKIQGRGIKNLLNLLK